MNGLPPRFLTVLALLGSAAAGGAVFGAAEAARIVVGERLLLGDGQVITLLALGALGSGLLGAAGALPLALLPNRPLGRTRWLGFLWGVFVPVAGATGVTWFTEIGRAHV